MEVSLWYQHVPYIITHNLEVFIRKNSNQIIFTFWIEWLQCWLWGLEVNMPFFILTNFEKFCICIFLLLGTLVIVKIITVVLHQNNWNAMSDEHGLRISLRSLFSIFSSSLEEFNCLNMKDGSAKQVMLKSSFTC